MTIAPRERAGGRTGNVPLMAPLTGVLEGGADEDCLRLKDLAFEHDAAEAYAVAGAREILERSSTCGNCL